MAFTLIALYSALLIGVSLYVYNARTETRPVPVEEYTIGNREAGWFSIFASMVTLIGGGELLTVAAFAYLSDGAAITLLGGYSIGFLLLAWLAPRLRQRSSVRLYHSLPDLFYDQYGKLAGILAVLLSVLAFLALLILQLTAGTLVLTELIAVSELQAALICAAVIIIYLFFAGFRGVLLTDVIQLAVMLVGIPALAFVFIDLEQAGRGLASLHFGPVASLATLATGIFVILGSGDIWQRMYGAKTDSGAKRGLLTQAPDSCFSRS